MIGWISLHTTHRRIRAKKCAHGQGCKLRYLQRSVAREIQRWLFSGYYDYSTMTNACQASYSTNPFCFRTFFRPCAATGLGPITHPFHRARASPQGVYERLIHDEESACFQAATDIVESAALLLLSCVVSDGPCRAVPLESPSGTRKSSVSVWNEVRCESLPVQNGE